MGDMGDRGDTGGYGGSGEWGDAEYGWYRRIGRIRGDMGGRGGNGGWQRFGGMAEMGGRRGVGGSELEPCAHSYFQWHSLKFSVSSFRISGVERCVDKKRPSCALTVMNLIILPGPREQQTVMSNEIKHLIAGTATEMGRLVQRHECDFRGSEIKQP